MPERQPVLVAIDHATDVKRTLSVPRSVAKARGAEVHVVHMVPPDAVHVDGHMHVSPLESHDGSVSIGAPLSPTLRTGDHDGVRVRRVTLGGTPEHVIPVYSQLHQATLLVHAASLGLIDVDIEVTTGYTDSALLEAAARNCADLLVIGVAHRSSFDRLLFGSTLRVCCGARRYQFSRSHALRAYRRSSMTRQEASR